MEVYAPYVGNFNLRDLYENVFIGNIVNMDVTAYDSFILGDVLEHLTVSDAKSVLKKMSHGMVMFCVPYEMEQGTCYGNIHETHLQSDLTPWVISKRYPEYKLLLGDWRHGYYVNFLRK